MVCRPMPPAVFEQAAWQLLTTGVEEYPDSPHPAPSSVTVKIIT
jgi:hypothetical protein